MALLQRAILVFLFCSFLPAVLAASDLIIFDEDDPLGREYYDASIGSASRGSGLKLGATSRDKMPVTTNSAATGRVSGVLDWQSRAGGAWSMNLFRPGFQTINLTRYDSLVLQVNGPAPVPASALPVLEFHDARGRKASSSLIEITGEGVDGDAASWQRLVIPLRAFERETGFEAGRVRHLTFRQGSANRGSHLLWIDDVRLQAAERIAITNPPPAPRNLLGRSGDRTITVHWDPILNPEGLAYHIYRSASPDGPFSELPASPVKTPGIADVNVLNGHSYFYNVKAENEAGLGAASEILQLTPRAFSSDDEFLEYVQVTAFDFFWFEANPENGMIRDRTQPWSAASIAAIGFGLTAAGIAVDHGWIMRADAAERVARTLRTLWNTPQGTEDSGTSGYKGWFYHFLNFEDGKRFGSSELSSIDTALLLAGVLYAREFFDENNLMEQEIRSLAEQIFARVDWTWILNGGGTAAMGWYPDRGFTAARWKGYNEASLLYLLGLGASGANRFQPEQWKNWTQTYQWSTSFGRSFIHFAPLFGHQYSACWIDFRTTADQYTRSRGLTYFENSRRATLAQRAYCAQNPGKYPGYGSNQWGLTACDGPGSGGAHGYIARGAPPAENDDGTIAPTAAGGSLPFAPKECVEALRMMYDQNREKIWCSYGFRDAFNLKENWWGEDVIGIDQGPILIMAENYRTGRIWERMKRNEVLKRGLNEAGFRPFQIETQPQR